MTGDQFDAIHALLVAPFVAAAVAAIVCAVVYVAGYDRRRR